MDYCIPRLLVHMDSGAQKEAPLTKTERKLRKALSKTSRAPLLGACIHIALAKKSNAEFRKIIPQLKEQLRDAPALTCEVLGHDAVELLKQL
jgi:hypothetical protein